MYVVWLDDFNPPCHPGASTRLEIAAGCTEVGAFRYTCPVDGKTYTFERTLDESQRQAVNRHA